MPSLTSNIYTFGEFQLDPQKRVLRRGEEPIALTPKAFEVLVLLIQHSGEIVRKDELMKVVWPDSFVEESNLTQTVFMVRKALGETPDQRYILTIQGRGYRFAAEVKDLSENGHAGTDLGHRLEGVHKLGHDPKDAPGLLLGEAEGRVVVVHYRSINRPGKYTSRGTCGRKKPGPRKKITLQHHRGEGFSFLAVELLAMCVIVK